MKLLAVETSSELCSVALLRDGAVAQMGSPQEVYERPVDLWAALLTGSASTIVAHAEVAGAKLALTIAGARVVATGGAVQSARAGSLDSTTVLIRPDWATLEGPLGAIVRVVRYEGPHTDYTLETPAGSVIVRESRAPRFEPGDRVGWSVQRAWVLAEQTPRE